MEQLTQVVEEVELLIKLRLVVEVEQVEQVVQA
jgi:hypothetical protein